MLRTGKALLIGSIALIFLTYSNFGPTALASDQIADYVKNHFVREIIFGWALAALTIRKSISAESRGQLLEVALWGSIVVLPFWIANLFGWSVGGLTEVWGASIRADDAFVVHGAQVALFYTGLAFMVAGLRIKH